MTKTQHGSECLANKEAKKKVQEEVEKKAWEEAKRKAAEELRAHKEAERRAKEDAEREEAVQRTSEAVEERVEAEQWALEECLWEEAGWHSEATVVGPWVSRKMPMAGPSASRQKAFGVQDPCTSIEMLKVMGTITDELWRVNNLKEKEMGRAKGKAKEKAKEESRRARIEDDDRYGDG
ncbi:hypothetical protein ID866_9664 [Astraeus odoratus]|nr:hypothetical protein ID866_9664 [Astraeus odoratus]